MLHYWDQVHKEIGLLLGPSCKFNLKKILLKPWNSTNQYTFLCFVTPMLIFIFPLWELHLFKDFWTSKTNWLIILWNGCLLKNAQIKCFKNLLLWSLYPGFVLTIGIRQGDYKGAPESFQKSVFLPEWGLLGRPASRL